MVVMVVGGLGLRSGLCSPAVAYRICLTLTLRLTTHPTESGRMVACFFYSSPKPPPPPFPLLYASSLEGHHSRRNHQSFSPWGLQNRIKLEDLLIKQLQLLRTLIKNTSNEQDQSEWLENQARGAGTGSLHSKKIDHLRLSFFFCFSFCF